MGRGVAGFLLTGAHARLVPMEPLPRVHKRHRLVTFITKHDTCPTRLNLTFPVL